MCCQSFELLSIWWMRISSHYNLIYIIFLDKVWHFFISKTICIIFSVHCTFFPFIIRFLVFLFLSFLRSSLYIRKISPFAVLYLQVSSPNFLFDFKFHGFFYVRDFFLLLYNEIYKLLYLIESCLSYNKKAFHPGIIQEFTHVFF